MKNHRKSFDSFLCSTHYWHLDAPPSTFCTWLHCVCFNVQLEATYKYISILSLINYQENDSIRRQMNKFKLKNRCETTRQRFDVEWEKWYNAKQRSVRSHFAICINTSIVCRLPRVNPVNASTHETNAADLQYTRWIGAAHRSDIYCMSRVQWEQFLLFCFVVRSCSGSSSCFVLFFPTAHNLHCGAFERLEN